MLAVSARNTVNDFPNGPKKAGVCVTGGTRCTPRRVLASRGTGPGMRLGWSGMTLAIDGRAAVQKGRDVLRGGGPVACVMPVMTEFVTLLLADFVTGYPA